MQNIHELGLSHSERVREDGWEKMPNLLSLTLLPHTSAGMLPTCVFVMINEAQVLCLASSICGLVL
jgi:hypothetical protein